MRRGIPPEQSKALSALKTILTDWDLYHRECLPEGPQVMHTGCSAIYNLEATKDILWHEAGWRWNQSGAKISTYLESGFQVVMRKFNARAVKGSSLSSTSARYYRRPHKVWIYTVTTERSETTRAKKCWVVWCEAGYDDDDDDEAATATKEQQQPLSSIVFENTSLEELYRVFGIGVG